MWLRHTHIWKRNKYRTCRLNNKYILALSGRIYRYYCITWIHRTMSSCLHQYIKIVNTEWITCNIHCTLHGSYQNALEKLIHSIRLPIKICIYFFQVFYKVTGNLVPPRWANMYYSFCMCYIISNAYKNCSR